MFFWLRFLLLFLLLDLQLNRHHYQLVTSHLPASHRLTYLNHYQLHHQELLKLLVLSSRMSFPLTRLRCYKLAKPVWNFDYRSHRTVLPLGICAVMGKSS
jgi:hypothetical protein